MKGHLARTVHARRSIALAIGVALVVLALCATAGAALASSSPSGSPAAGATSLTPPVLKVGYSQDYDGLNPFVNYSPLSWEIFLLNYNFLTWYDKDYKPTPELATKWQQSPDGKVWTFTIRSDVKWHDGVPLTARDIAFTYNYVIKNNISLAMSYLKDVAKVEAPNDTTLVITSHHPNPMMLAMYVPIVPEHIWSKIPGSQVQTLKDPPTIGSGPFAIAEAQQGRFVKMTANRDYFAGAPHVKTVLFQIYTTEDGLVQDYKGGALDLGIFEVPTSLRSIANVTGSKTIAAPTVGFTMLAFNCWKSPKSKGNPLLTDVRIRQAVAWAVDKAKIAATTMSGKAQVGTSVLSPAMGDWHWQPTAAQVVGYDPAKANALLDAAGYKMGPGGVRVAPNGKPLDFKLDAIADYPDEVSAAKMIVPYLKSVGIKARLEVMSEGAFSDRIYGNQGVDMYIWAWGGDLDPSYQLSAFTTDQILNNNDSCYSNPTYDALFTQQSTTVDRTKRLDIVHQMQQILYNDTPYDVLWYDTNLQAYRADRWTGWQLAPPGAPSVTMNYQRATYTSLQPVTATQSTSGGGLGTGAIVAIVAGAAIVIAIVVWLILRRKPGEVEGA